MSLSLLLNGNVPDWSDLSMKSLTVQDDIVVPEIVVGEVTCDEVITQQISPLSAGTTVLLPYGCGITPAGVIFAPGGFTDATGAVDNIFNEVHVVNNLYCNSFLSQTGGNMVFGPTAGTYVELPSSFQIGSNVVSLQTNPGLRVLVTQNGTGPVSNKTLDSSNVYSGSLSGTIQLNGTIHGNTADVDVGRVFGVTGDFDYISTLALNVPGPCTCAKATCNITRNGVTTVASDFTEYTITFTDSTWNTVPSSGYTANIFSGGAPTRFTNNKTTACYWNVVFSSLKEQDMGCYMGLVKNGTQIAQFSNFSTSNFINWSYIVSMAAGDYLTVWVSKNTGSTDFGSATLLQRSTIMIMEY